MAIDGALDVGLYQRRFLGPFNDVKEFHYAIQNLVIRTVVPYPDENLNEPRPGILSSFGSLAEELRKSFENNT